ncbi:MAG: hypothetical protein WD342_09035 [Verrucomicrobiales bacterium]
MAPKQAKRRSTRKTASERKGGARNDAAAADPDADRAEAFAALAKARAAGEVVALPRMLPAEERRRHVRSTLREDHLFHVRFPRRT